jgi:hypothetical protein
MGAYLVSIGFTGSQVQRFTRFTGSRFEKVETVYPEP